GLLLANLLGARGVHTHLFDKRTEPLVDSMAIGITPPSLEILHALGLDRVFCQTGVAMRRAEVYEARTRIGRLDFAGLASEYPFFLSLPQAKTTELLRENLAQFPTVIRHEGVEFTDLRQEPASKDASRNETAVAPASDSPAEFVRAR